MKTASYALQSMEYAAAIIGYREICLSGGGRGVGIVYTLIHLEIFLLGKFGISFCKINNFLQFIFKALLDFCRSKVVNVNTNLI